MRRPLLLLALALVLGGVVASPGGATRGQQVPTPRGQLGGPERLQPTPLLPSPPVPTATASPPPAPTPSPTAPPATPVLDRTDDQPPEEITAQAQPAVVVVVAVDNSVSAGTPSASAEVAATGSGFVFDAAGHVLTDAAVVGDRPEVVVFLADGERRGARVVGVDPLTGIAVLRIEGVPPAALPLAPDPPRAGETVVALGTPGSELPARVDVGFVNAAGHGSDAVLPATDLIRFNAPSFDGVGGGPVLNLRGEVVGMRLDRSSIAAARGRPGLPGIDLPDLPDLPNAPDLPLPGVSRDAPLPSSFAVPVAILQRVAADIVTDGRAGHPYLGARLAAVTPRLAVERGLSAAVGAVVLEVEPDGPASSAGLRTDDLILALDGERIDVDRSFLALFFARQPGERVRLTVQRGSDEVDIEVALGERPAN